MSCQLIYKSHHILNNEKAFERSNKKYQFKLFVRILVHEWPDLFMDRWNNSFTLNRALSLNIKY